MENTPQARNLRKNQTDAERTLWQKLRARGLEGHKVRRQVPLGPYIVDFVCKSVRLVVEIDGGQHAEQEEYDRKRAHFLSSQGYEVVRFWNNEVLENLAGVLEALTLTLSQRERELAVKNNISPRGRGN